MKSIDLVIPFLCLATSALAQDQPTTKPVPKLQILPQPYDQAAFMRDDQEIARYHFGAGLHRPFIFPVVGPSGRSLTRMAHPRDPQSHSHHNSVWISHHIVNGVSFWADEAKARGKIVHQRLDNYEDLGEVSWVSTTNAWIDEATGKTLMLDRRRTTVQLLPNNELLMTIDLQLEAPKDQPVTLGKTSFGLIGVRMAKTISELEKFGGELRNSECKSGEKDIFWKPAKWVDYSGPIREGVTEGITLMDHPSNPNHPSTFHVRGDGWMGASLTLDADRIIEPGKPLRLCYTLYVHAGKPTIQALDNRWADFAKTQPPDLNPPTRKK